MGCVVGARRPRHAHLPQVISLPHKPSKLPYTRPEQFPGRLGMEHDLFYLIGDFDHPMKFSAPTLSMSGGMSAARLVDRHALLKAMNSARSELDQEADVQIYIR